jgi:hypothetical protein
MKTKNLLFALIAIATTFSLGSCKKDKDTPSNSFSYNSQNYLTPTAAGSGEASESARYTDVYFSSIDPTNSATLTGKASQGFIEFAIYPLVAGKYTFKVFDAPDFDGTKNFAAADFDMNMTMANSQMDFATGTHLSEDDITDGTITVAKNGDVYTFTYSITYKSGILTGSYTGKVAGL